MQTVHTAYGFAQRNGSQAHVPAHGSGDPGAADAGAATAGGPTDTVSSWTKTTSVRAYDVENHLRTVQTTRQSTGASKTNLTTTGPATTIGWGPNGHPASIVANYPGGITTNETLHWDGDTILFVTDAAGNVTDFKVGLEGDVTPRDATFSGLSVYDRDPAGVIVQTSNSTGSTGFNPLDPSTVSGAGAVGTTGYQAANVPEQYVRGDGFMVAGVQINGVRAFDPNLGAWTTPDAYEGEVHDPVSQQRYMWNRGNAADYSDPSGYDAIVKVNGNNVKIVIPLTITGGTHDQRLAIKNAIQSQWSGDFGNLHVMTKVVEGKANNLTVSNTPGLRAFSSNDRNGHYNNAVVTTADRDFAWGASHEAGHLMGLGDKYKDVAGQGSVAIPGFDHNVMGARDQTGVTKGQIQQIIRSPQNTH